MKGWLVDRQMDEIEGYTIWYTHKVNRARGIGNITHTKGKKEIKHTHSCSILPNLDKMHVVKKRY